MAHNINFNEKTKQYSFVSARKCAWHALGQLVDGAMTSTEAIKLAGLDYTVEKGKVFVKYSDELKKERNVFGKTVPNTYATYRTDTLDVFSIVGNNYTILQNIEAFNFMDSIVGKDKAIYETAGALGAGETIFITAKLPYYIKINGTDTIENYLVVTNSHNGKKTLSIFLTPIRVVCENTLALGRSTSKITFNIKHTSSITWKMEDAKNILDISKSITIEMQEVLTKLSSIKVTDEKVENYFNKLILTPNELQLLTNTKLKYFRVDEISTRKKNVLKDINKYYKVGIGQDKIIGTAYGAYNAVNGYLSNVKKYKNNSKKMENLVLGGNDFNLNNKALDLAMDLEYS